MLGVLGIETGSQPRAAGRVRAAQQAFWGWVNQQGGIGGVRVDVRDHVAEDEAVAFLATSESASPRLQALPRDTFVAGTLPASSRWLFEDRVLQTGASACVQAMNAVELVAYRGTKLRSVAVVHAPDELGQDARAGVRLAADLHGYELAELSTRSGGQQGIVDALLDQAADVIVLATPPRVTAAIVVGLARRGFGGELVTTHRGWDASLLEERHGWILAERLSITVPWREFALATKGHGIMRAALGRVQPHDDYTAGWVGNYPMLALLREARRSGELTRRGLAAAARRVAAVDHDGMIPPLAGSPFSGGPAAQAAVPTALAVPEPASPGGTRSVEDFFDGLTVATHGFERPCFETG